MTETEIYAALSSDIGLSAIVGSRIYNAPSLPEKEPLPAVTFEDVSERPVNTLAGDTGRSRIRYTFSVWAASKADAKALEAALRSALSSQYRLGRVPLHEPEFGVYRYAVDYSILNQ